MLFARRRWAIRVTEQMGIPIRSKEATWLIEAAIWGAKNITARKLITKRQAVIIVVSGMADNATAVNNLRREIGLDEAEARAFLKAAQIAALALAAEYGETKIFEIAQRRNSN